MRLTGSFLVGILVAIIVVMIWRTVKVPLLIVWDRFAEKHFPLPAITHFYEKGLDGDPIGGMLPIALGMRVLIITETLEYSEETKDLFFVMVGASKKALEEEYPLFKLRSLAVEKRNSPLQYSSSLCGPNGELMEKCYKAWGKTQAVFNMNSRKKNVDLFLYDGGLAVDGKVINYTAMYLFDSTLPVTVEVLDKMGEKAPDDPAGETAAKTDIAKEADQERTDAVNAE